MNEPSPALLEDRIRAALHARAGATVVDPAPRPLASARPASAPPRRWLVPVGVAGVGLAAAAVVVGVVVVVDTDGARRTVVAGPDATVAGGEGVDPPVAPLLGPLPYLVLDLPGAAPTTAAAVTGSGVAAEPPSSAWHVQAFETDAGFAGPRASVLSVPHLDADGPDDIGYRYRSSATEAVTVQDEPARLLVQGRFAGVWWPGGGDGGVLVSSWDLGADEVVAIADGLVDRAGAAGGWDVGHLPAGLVATVDGARGDVVEPWWHANVQYRTASGGSLSLSVSTGGDVTFADRTAPDPGQEMEPVTVAGRPAVLVHVGGEPLDYTVLWQQSETIIGELWASGPTREEVLAAAASVREVDEATWRAALPAGVLDPAAQAALLAELAPGTPLPGGATWEPFLVTDTLSTPPADGVLVERVQYLSDVARHAACEWQWAWIAARESDDGAGAGTALAALRGSGGWSAVAEVVDAMAASGAPDVHPDDVVSWARTAIEAGDVAAARTDVESFCR